MSYNTWRSTQPSDFEMYWKCPSKLLSELTAVLAIACSANAAAQTPQIFAKQVAAATASINNKTLVYFVPEGKRWMKQVLQATDVTYDVKRTDSALTPLVGIVNATIIVYLSQGLDSEGAAAEAGVAPDTYYRLSANFIQSDPPGQKWVFKSGKAMWFNSDDRKFGDLEIIGNRDVPYEIFITGMSK